jgi:hypothetical protein
VDLPFWRRFCHGPRLECDSGHPEIFKYIRTHQRQNERASYLAREAEGWRGWLAFCFTGASLEDLSAACDPAVPWTCAFSADVKPELEAAVELGPAGGDVAAATGMSENRLGVTAIS